MNLNLNLEPQKIHESYESCKSLNLDSGLAQLANFPEEIGKCGEMECTTTRNRDFSLLKFSCVRIFCPTVSVCWDFHKKIAVLAITGVKKIAPNRFMNLYLEIRYESIRAHESIDSGLLFWDLDSPKMKRFDSWIKSLQKMRFCDFYSRQGNRNQVWKGFVEL